MPPSRLLGEQWRYNVPSSHLMKPLAFGLSQTTASGAWSSSTHQLSGQLPEILAVSWQYALLQEDWQSSLLEQATQSGGG